MLMSMASTVPSSHLTPVARFSGCPQSFPASGSFPGCRLFASGGQSVGASASASIVPVNIWGCFPLRLTDLLVVQGTVKSLLQHHSLKASVVQHSAFPVVQLSHLSMITVKTVTLIIWTFVGKVMSLLFNTLSRFVIAFLRGVFYFHGCSHRLQSVTVPFLYTIYLP